MKVEVAVQGSPPLVIRRVTVDSKNPIELELFSFLISANANRRKGDSPQKSHAAVQKRRQLQTRHMGVV